MVRVQAWYVAGLLFTGMAARAECFRSAGEAATQVGLRDEFGYQLAGVSRDVFGGRRWAEVRSCKHPEWPSVRVALEGGRPAAEAPPNDHTAVVRVGHTTLVRAGSRVTVMSADAVVRLETSGVALASGAVGDVVKVRLLGEGPERFVTGVVRGAELLEMVR